MTERDVLLARTRDHYNRYPFEFIGRDRVDVRAVQPPPMRVFADRYLEPGFLVADVGCGPGRALLFLEALGVRPVGCDMSEGSIVASRSRTTGTTYVQSNCLELPFPDSTFDALVCDGVLHHTPDAQQGLAELARILRPGGVAYVSVYKRWRYYAYLYRYVGAPIRTLARSSLGRGIVDATLVNLYHALQMARGHVLKTRAGSRNFFYDYFLTPRASFHSRRQITRWGTQLGLRLLSYDRYPGSNCHSFVFGKR